MVLYYAIFGLTVELKLENKGDLNKSDSPLDEGTFEKKKKLSRTKHKPSFCFPPPARAVVLDVAEGSPSSHSSRFPLLLLLSPYLLLICRLLWRKRLAGDGLQLDPAFTLALWCHHEVGETKAIPWLSGVTMRSERRRRS